MKPLHKDHLLNWGEQTILFSTSIRKRNEGTPLESGSDAEAACLESVEIASRLWDAAVSAAEKEEGMVLLFAESVLDWVRHNHA